MACRSPTASGRRVLVLLAALLAAACASPEHRIKRHPERFASYPPEVQRKIKEGKVELGFTKEQAEMALGRPDRKYDRKTAEGPAEVWAYGGGRAGRAGGGVGVSGGAVYGFGGGGGGGLFGIGIGTDGGRRPEERLRLVFRDGRVAAIEEPRS